MTFGDFVELCINHPSLDGVYSSDIIPNSIWTMVDVRDNDPESLFLVIGYIDNYEPEDGEPEPAWKIKWLKTGKIITVPQFTLDNYAVPVHSDLLERIGEIQ